jgi:hypothetical protein
MISAGAENLPRLTPLGEEFEYMANKSLAALPEDAKEGINARFQMIMRNRHPGETGQVVLFTTTLGEPPGSIIAAEVIDRMPHSPRRLQWAWGEQSTRI